MATKRIKSMKEKELTNDLNQVDLSLIALEQLKISLLKQRSKIENNLVGLHEIGAIKYDIDNHLYMNVEYHQHKEFDFIKISINDLLPHYKRMYDEISISKQYQLNDLKDYYTVELIKLLNSLKNSDNIHSFGKSYISIVQYFPSKQVRDLDNRFHNFIFNAVKHTQLINDDNWENLSYSEKGFYTKDHGYTEIYITSQSNEHSLNEYINNIG